MTNPTDGYTPESSEAARSLGSLSAVLRRRWLPALVFALAVPAIVFAYSSHRQNQYTATAFLLFRDPGFDQKLFGSSLAGPNVDPTREAATNVGLLSLRSVAARTAREVPGETAASIASRLRVEAQGQSDLVAVVIEDPSPRKAASIANLFAAEYVKFRRDADRAKISSALDLLNRQIAVLTPAQSNTREGRDLQSRADQLKVLAALQTGNAESVQEADIPTSPSSPHTWRDTVIGLLFGLLGAALLVAVIERMDRRLHDPHQVEVALGRPTLGAVPESRALKRFPHESRELPLAEREAFRMIRANLRYFDFGQTIRSILITSAAAGDGKSTVARHLAAEIAASASRTLLIEADLRHPTQAMGLPGLDGSLGISQVLTHQRTLEEAIQTAEIFASDSGTGAALDVLLAGPPPPNPLDLLESDEMKSILRTAQEEYEMVIIDAPPLVVVSDAIPLIREVSGVIVVARLGKSTREPMLRLRRALSRLDAFTLGAVVNGVQAADDYGYTGAYTEPPSVTPLAN